MKDEGEETVDGLLALSSLTCEVLDLRAANERVANVRESRGEILEHDISAHANDS